MYISPYYVHCEMGWQPGPCELNAAINVSRCKNVPRKLAMLPLLVSSFSSFCGVCQSGKPEITLGSSPPLPPPAPLHPSPDTKGILQQRGNSAELRHTSYLCVRSLSFFGLPLIHVFNLPILKRLSPQICQAFFWAVCHIGLIKDPHCLFKFACFLSMFHTSSFWLLCARNVSRAFPSNVRLSYCTVSDKKKAPWSEKFLGCL